MDDVRFSKITKTTYTVNGKTYNSIDEVPAEYRELIKNMQENPPKEGGVAITMQTEVNAGLPGPEKSSHREKFLREAVYPNLHLMDDKAIKTVMSDLQDTPKRSLNAVLKLLLWTALISTSGLLILKFLKLLATMK